MSQSNRHRTRKPRHDARTLPRRGDGDDKGRYFSCWYCGWVCDIERDYRGPRTGEYYEDAIEPSLGSLDRTSPLNGLTVLGGITQSHRLMELDGSGTPKTIQHTFLKKVSAGCPNCGTQNWKGDQ